MSNKNINKNVQNFYLNRTDVKLGDDDKTDSSGGESGCNSRPSTGHFMLFFHSFLSLVTILQE